MVPRPAIIIKVTVKTRIPEFRLLPEIEKHPMGVNKTWNDLLTEFDYPRLAASEFCIKGSIRGTPVFSMDDKIQRLVDIYKKSISEYKVTLAKITAADLVKLKKPKKRASKKPLHSVRQPAGRQNGRARMSPLAGTSSRVNNSLPHFPEGAFPFQVEEIAGLGNNFLGNGYANDDNESMASQDSQDEREDIKTTVLNNFVKGMSNGELHRIRDELACLRRDHKIMRVAKYIPLGMNFFNVIFGGDM